MKLKNAPINAEGYGSIPKLVMRAQNLSIGAKAVYAYISSFAGAGDTAFPSRKSICFDLKVDNNTLGKYLNELTAGHYIEIEKARTKKGTFQNNAYKLTTDVNPCMKKPYMDTPYTAEPYMAEPYTVKPHTKSNIKKSNIVKSNIEQKKDIERQQYGEFGNVFLSDEEVEKLKKKFPSDWEKWIKILDEGIESKGYKYKSHYAAILNWARRDEPKKKEEAPVYGVIHY